MDVKEAIAIAKRYVKDVFVDEAIENIGLEELEFDDDKDIWSVTLGFSRPWHDDRLPTALQVNAFSQRKRDYKVLRISDQSGKVLSIKNREVVT
jgi:hypothetical protein